MTAKIRVMIRVAKRRTGAGENIEDVLAGWPKLSEEESRRYEMRYDIIIKIAETNTALSRLCETLIEELAQYKEIEEEEDRYRKIIGKTEYNR